MRAFASAATRAIRSGLRHPSPALSTATYKSRGARDAAARPLPCAFHTYPPANMPQTAETASFKFNHTMLRVKDPKKSIAFYTETLGMELISELPQSGFTLYFLGYCDPSLSADERAASRFSREGVLELTHNHGTETDESFSYASGNADPGRGFGHIAITVDDVDAACARFEERGVPFKKRPNEGSMKGLAFILDPDGYWVEVVSNRFRG